MSILSVYHVSSPELPNKVLTHLEDITSTLAEQGIIFERLPATTPVTAGAAPQDVISAYRDVIDRLMTARGHVAVDVISVDTGHPQKNELRAGWLDPHLHAADETRFFIAGRGLCSFRLGDFVYSVLCEKNDLITVPVGTPQWFDIGEDPRVIILRLFNQSNGKNAVPSEDQDNIAARFPRLDD